MKERSVTKPTLNTSQALKFATESSVQKQTRKENTNEGKTNNKIFFAPKGDKRLTINIREDLHKKLKFAALDQDTTVGEIIENLIEKNF